MMGNFAKHYILLKLVTSLSFLTASCATLPTNISTDQSALLALRAQIISSEPHHFLGKNWNIHSPVCEWIGVTCGSHHLRVTALNVSNMNLTGTIPPQLGNLSFLVSLDMSANKLQGELPVQFAGFRRLQVLDLSVNDLEGHIPPWIGSLHEVTYLNLGNNSFTGRIPPSISNMTKLSSLGLFFNSLQGNIPSEIFNISSLQVISLKGNSLSGSLPDYMCQNLQLLYWMQVSENELNGQIPSSLGQCLQLQTLSLSYNKLTGEIPHEIGYMTKLETLYLAMNSLEGAVPKGIGNLTVLKWLDFGDNNLTGVIPGEIGNLHNIEEINFGTNHLTGVIPTEMLNLSTVRRISVAFNKLSGNLPTTMGYGLPNLERLYFDFNNFSGAIPDSISNCSNLYLIEFGRNSFTGPIPISLGDLRLLTTLDFQQNNLISDPSQQLSFIKSLENCRDLAHLVLSYNPLNGYLPDSIGNLSNSLESMYLYNCKVRGSIPSGIGNLSSLSLLALGKNQLTGSLPNAIKDLQNIQGIDLSGNSISISLQFFCGFGKLVVLYLGVNHILGPIPECLGNVTSMRYLYLNSNRLNSSLPKNIWNLKDLLVLNLSLNSLVGSIPHEIKNLNHAAEIDLSMNQLSGGLPSTIGEMQSLVYLSLAYNKLQGSIPESIGNMLSLERLDLSHNFLYGSIPKTLENLKYLTFFNVSFNNLSGEIPSGGPFGNFSAESFISNEALCGPQRFRLPQCPNSSGHKLRMKTVRHIVFILLGMILIATAMFSGFVYLRYRRKGKIPNNQANVLVTQERISYYKLQQATNGYSQSNLLGIGSFGSVYKGILDDERVVAIKVFNLQVAGSIESFDAECEVLRNIRHRNLTKIISSCSNSDFKALILEYMANGDLEKWLHSNECFLNIMHRLDILIDVACALQYLHCENPTPIIHCDLKPSNILLDSDMVAHVGDFGIAKLLGHEDSITYTKTLATIGYLAPEYGLGGLVSTRSDVYSFGIVMMEVFTKKSPNNEMFSDNLSLKSWVEDAMSKGIGDHVIDNSLLTEADQGECFAETLACASSVMEVALTCTKESPGERSNVQDVFTALNKIKRRWLNFL